MASVILSSKDYWQLIHFFLDPAQSYVAAQVCQAARASYKIPSRSRRIQLHENILVSAVEDGNLRLLQWAVKANMRAPGTLCELAVGSGSLEALKLAYQAGAPLTMVIFCIALRFDRRDIHCWLKEQDCPLPADGVLMALMNGNVEVAEWCIQNGFCITPEVVQSMALTGSEPSFFFAVGALLTSYLEKSMIAQTVALRHPTNADSKEKLMRLFKNHLVAEDSVALLHACIDGGNNEITMTLLRSDWCVNDIILDHAMHKSETPVILVIIQRLFPTMDGPLHLDYEKRLTNMAMYANNCPLISHFYEMSYLFPIDCEELARGSSVAAFHWLANRLTLRPTFCAMIVAVNKKDVLMLDLLAMSGGPLGDELSEYTMRNQNWKMLAYMFFKYEVCRTTFILEALAAERGCLALVAEYFKDEVGVDPLPEWLNFFDSPFYVLFSKCLTDSV